MRSVLPVDGWQVNCEYSSVAIRLSWDITDHRHLHLLLFVSDYGMKGLGLLMESQPTRTSRRGSVLFLLRPQIHGSLPPHARSPAPQTPAGCPQIQSSSDPNHLESAQTPQWRAQSCKTDPTSGADHKPRSPLLLTNQLQIRVSQRSLLRCSNLLKQLLEVGERFTYVHWFIGKDTKKDTEEQPGEGVQRSRSGGVLSVGAPIPVELGCTALLAPPWELSEPHCLGVSWRSY